jgi:hypothetical protein
MKLIRARVNILLDLTPSHSIVSDDTVIILGNSFRSQSSCRLALPRSKGDMLSQWPQPSCGMGPLLARQWSRRPIWKIQDHRHSHYRDRRQSDRGSRAADTVIRDAGAEHGWHPLGCQRGHQHTGSTIDLPCLSARSPVHYHRYGASPCHRIVEGG